jgi:hypothetical protein
LKKGVHAASGLSAKVQSSPIVSQETDIVVTHPTISGRVVGQPDCDLKAVGMIV